MPYREKTAWLALLAMALTVVPYLVIVATSTHPAAPMPDLNQLGLYARAALAQMVLLGLGHLYLRRSAPDEARIPPDERDRAIISRSMKAAYYVLVTGMILVGVVMPFNSGGWTIVNAAIFMIIAAEIVHYGVIVASYRRQA